VQYTTFLLLHPMRRSTDFERPLSDIPLEEKLAFEGVCSWRDLSVRVLAGSLGQCSLCVTERSRVPVQSTVLSPRVLALSCLQTCRSTRTTRRAASPSRRSSVRSPFSLTFPRIALPFNLFASDVVLVACWCSHLANGALAVGR
jgi:hypothetical protein